MPAIAYLVLLFGALIFNVLAKTNPRLLLRFLLQKSRGSALGFKLTSFGLLP